MKTFNLHSNYAAPEILTNPQGKGVEYGKVVDVYSFGVVITNHAFYTSFFFSITIFCFFF